MAQTYIPASPGIWAAVVTIVPRDDDSTEPLTIDGDVLIERRLVVAWKEIPPHGSVFPLLMPDDPSSEERSHTFIPMDNGGVIGLTGVTFGREYSSLDKAVRHVLKRGQAILNSQRRGGSE